MEEEQQKAIVIQRMPNFEVLETFTGENSHKLAYAEMYKIHKEKNKDYEELIKKGEAECVFDHDFDVIHGDESFINQFILSAERKSKYSDDV